MPGWDDDSPELSDNLRAAFALIEASALQRRAPSLDDMKTWHRTTMKGLTVPNVSVAGNFRGATGHPYLRDYNVQIGTHTGVDAGDVEAEAASFLSELETQVRRLDGVVPQGSHPVTESTIDKVITLAAWAHAEWVRIHPFANGNGRTARMWANWILMRYGMPPFVVLRPRPGGTYGAAGAAAMTGDIAPTVQAFQDLYSAWTP